MKAITIVLLFILGLMISCKKDTSRQKPHIYMSSLQNQTDNAIHKDASSADTCHISITPSKIWTFDFKKNNFPCDTIGFTIKGFAVDADSVFYIMGGTPTTIAKYCGMTMLSRKNLELNLEESYNALFQVCGDSVYFIDEQDKVIYALNKELGNTTTAFSLPLESEDSIIFGRMEKNSYVLMTQKKNPKECSLNDCSIWCFEYPNVLKKQYKNENNLYSHLSGYCHLNDSANFLFYQGLIGENRIFLTPPEYDNCLIVAANAVGECIYKDSLKNLPPISAVSGYEEHYGALQSENLRTILNDNLYLTGFDSKTHKFYIIKYSFFD